MLTSRLDHLASLPDAKHIRIERNVPLSAHTTFRIGGAAAIGVFPADEEQMMTALSEIRACDIPYAVIGGGSNLLAPDKGYCGAVLFTGGMKRIVSEETDDGKVLVTADAGVSLGAFAKYAQERGLAGADFLYGIPGSIGGAVVMNAGAYGGEISQILHASRYLDALDPSEIRERNASEHRYAYRHSVYLESPSEIVVSASFVLTRDDPDVILSRMRALLGQRKEKQPLEYPSAGSFFRRPVGAFAAKLIDDCGLKGYRVGDAQVSVKHAGFVVNLGNATEADVRRLASDVRATVFERTGYLLESEVRVMTGEPL